MVRPMLTAATGGHVCGIRQQYLVSPRQHTSTAAAARSGTLRTFGAAWLLLTMFVGAAVNILLRLRRTTPRWPQETR
jgi:hypothetical protein